MKPNKQQIKDIVLGINLKDKIYYVLLEEDIKMPMWIVKQVKVLAHKSQIWVRLGVPNFPLGEWYAWI